jgi:hypothetical protein
MAMPLAAASCNADRQKLTGKLATIDMDNDIVILFLLHLSLEICCCLHTELQ